MKDQFIEIYTHRIRRPGADKLLQWLESTDFYRAPASTRSHLARAGGLVEHSLCAYERLRSLFVWEFRNGSMPTLAQDESIAVCGLLHDISKVSVMGYKFEDSLPYGHGEISVYIISAFMSLTHEEAMAIRWHTGFSDNEGKADGDSVRSAFEQFPLALLTHIAALQTTYLDEVKKAGKRLTR